MMGKEAYKVNPETLRHMIYPKTMKLDSLIEVMDEKYTALKEAQLRKA